jgi:hypothetical protein
MDLFENRVPPGVDEAAYVKAAWLASVVSGRGLHSFPFLLNLRLLCPFPLNSSLPCPPYIPNSPVDVSRRCSTLSSNVSDVSPRSSS